MCVFVWFKRGDVFVDVISAIYSIERSQLWNCSIVQINLLIRNVCRANDECVWTAFSLACFGSLGSHQKLNKWKGLHGTFDTDDVHVLPPLHHPIIYFMLHIQITIYVYKFWTFRSFICHEETFKTVNRKHTVNISRSYLLMRKTLSMDRLSVSHIWVCDSFHESMPFVTKLVQQEKGGMKAKIVATMKNQKRYNTPTHASQLINHINHIEMSMNVQ